jgi:uncharacterized protein (TIGR00730 family)
VCVFCGSAAGRGSGYAGAARTMAEALARRGATLVYGGGRVGLMGVLADAALAAGTKVTGVIPRALVEREVAHDRLTELHVVDDMHTRKALMAELSDGFVALPGGAGTLEELFEVWTWGLLGLHRKPVGLLDVDNYYRSIREHTSRMVAEGFLTAAYRDMLLVAADPDQLLDQLDSYTPPPEKWSETQALTVAPARPAPVDAVGWVRVVSGRLLCVRGAGKDAFYLPGGKREPGESDWQTLDREVGEEVGLALRPESLTLAGLFTAPAHGYPAGTLVRMACYYADPRPDGRRPRPGAEIEELAWLAAADRDRCAPALRLLLDELIRRGELA